MEEEPRPAQLGPLEITEEDVEASSPRVRALLVARLEAMWEPVRASLLTGDDGRPPDPRMLEIGLRICRELGQHYRLFRAPVAKPEEEEEQLGAGVDRGSLIENQLKEIEDKLRSQGT